MDYKLINLVFFHFRKHFVGYFLLQTYFVPYSFRGRIAKNTMYFFNIYLVKPGS